MDKELVSAPQFIQGIAQAADAVRLLEGQSDSETPGGGFCQALDTSRRRPDVICSLIGFFLVFAGAVDFGDAGLHLRRL